MLKLMWLTKSERIRAQIGFLVHAPDKRRKQASQALYYLPKIERSSEEKLKAAQNTLNSDLGFLAGLFIVEGINELDTR